MSRHLARFGEKRRMGAYERLEHEMQKDHLKFPQMRAEMRTLALDGSKLPTHYTCPIIDPGTGEIINADRVTCPEGGYVPASGDKGGHGWNVVQAVTLTGLVFGSQTIPLNRSERQAGAEVIDRLNRDFGAELNPDKTHVLIADGGFNSPEVRRACERGGFVEQIHYASHVDAPKSKRHARERNQRRYGIEGYPNWYANGHRELSCKCGQHKLSRRTSRKDGVRTVRTEGECVNCGSISITAGLWRRGNTALNARQFVRCQPGEEAQADWSFGNFLTFNDPIAAEYGRKRFAHNEGFHGHITQRFQLFKGKRWFRRTAQARTDRALVSSITHSLAMEQRTRAGQAPPG